MKKFFVVICLAIGISMVLPSLGSSAKDINTDKPSEVLLYHDIAISMLLPHIQEQINEFYSTILTETPSVYPYMVHVINVKRLGGFRSFLFSVTFKVIPVVGPHISVGVDKMTFKIESSTVKLTKFSHIKTEELPPHWQHIVR